MHEINWKEEYLKQKEYVIALEATRRDLWGVNEELRIKIDCLEKGQEDLQMLYKMARVDRPSVSEPTSV